MLAHMIISYMYLHSNGQLRLINEYSVCVCVCVWGGGGGRGRGVRSGGVEVMRKSRVVYYVNSKLVCISV